MNGGILMATVDIGAEGEAAGTLPSLSLGTTGLTNVAGRIRKDRNRVFSCKCVAKR